MSSHSKPSSPGTQMSKDAHAMKPSQAAAGAQHGQGKAREQKHEQPQQQQHSKAGMQPGQSSGAKGGTMDAPHAGRKS